MLKMIYLIYDSGLDKQAVHILKNLNIKKYTKLEKVKGAGNSGLKFANSIGPGENNLLFVICDEKQVNRLKMQVKAFKKNLLEKQGLKLFILPVEEEI